MKARFNPKKKNDLTELAPPIGWVGEVEPVFTIDDGEYEGQQAYLPKEKYGWIPECDLEIEL